MELPDIGEFCAEPTCKRLDFLPLKCKCSQSFCSKHFEKHAYECYSGQRNVERTEDAEVFLCSQPDCCKANFFPIICGKCNKNYCIEHRHTTICSNDDLQLEVKKEKFEFPVQQFNEAKSKVQQQIATKLEKAKRKNKNSNIANKVEFMLLKRKAIGLKTIPTHDRIYFNITCPKKEKDKNYPVFVSKFWSIGKIIDYIAEEIKLVNNNNKSSELKLRLFKSNSGCIITPEMSVFLDTLLTSEDVFDGEELILDYVSNNCLKIDISL